MSVAQLSHGCMDCEATPLEEARMLQGRPPSKPDSERSAGARKNEGHHLMACDLREVAAVELGTRPSGGGELIVRDSEGKPLFDCPTGTGGDLPT